MRVSWNNNTELKKLKLNVYVCIIIIHKNIIKYLKK